MDIEGSSIQQQEDESEPASSAFMPGEHFDPFSQEEPEAGKEVRDPDANDGTCHPEKKSREPRSLLYRRTEHLGWNEYGE
ncbi:hypothetical protein HD597_000447 [Nonomuraea thailandensis]|uniref:Uncharacterized protein n=1 Tax=Nonomuraea thailandensis TaxID=1188745 RepID=A0A9X2G9B4_9ACTN|nr:hypothetical protein [Nonomuraea thailandensis]MCP2353427.1 hypothetical protein [Nonomuraea thailandensis]